MAITHRRIGEISRMIGNYDQAISNLDRALAIEIAVRGEETLGVAEALIERAKTHAAMDAFALAEADGMRSVAIHESVSPPLPLADALVDIAVIMANAGQCERANTYLQKAKSVRVAEAQRADEWTAQATARLGDCTS